MVACRIFLLAAGLSASLLAGAKAQDMTFSIEGFTLGERVSAQDLERFDCTSSRWSGAERECHKKKEWKQVSAATTLFLDRAERLQMLRQKFDRIPLTEKAAEEVIAANSKRFDMEPRRFTKRLGNDQVIVAAWGDIALKEIGIQTRLAAIQGRMPDDLLLMDLIDNLDKSAVDVMPIYQIEGFNGAVWTFYIRAGGQGWAMARIISKSRQSPR